jgi:uncharacterized protein YcbX
MTDCTGVITQLFIYPIKSCAGIELSTSRLALTGLEMDREWLIVDQHGMFLTQRQIPHMVWITPALSETGLTLSAPNQADITVPFDTRGLIRSVTIWRDTVRAEDMGDAVAVWLDTFLAVPGKQFRLVRFAQNARRISSTEWTQGFEAPNMFSDGFATLIVTQSALDELNTRLRALGDEPVSMQRFRPNIVIEGLDAHAEDTLKTIRIHTINGLIELSLVKPCTRCAIPDIDPYTAQSTPAVSEALRSYRALTSMGGALCFGMNAIVTAGAGLTLHAGQPFDADYAF